MKSALPKVMHRLGGQSMISHVIASAMEAGCDRLALVVAPEMEMVMEAARQAHPEVSCHVQQPQLGTAHAVLAARDAIDGFAGDVLILYGDTPLLTPATLREITGAIRDGADVAVLGFQAADPSGYGRLICDEQGNLLAVREHKDATAEEREITFCNSGVFAFRNGLALSLLDKIGNENANGEYYLTDCVELAREAGLAVVAVSCSEEEVMGVNSRGQQAEAEAALQRRLRQAAIEGGATLVAPETVFLSSDTKIGRDVVIEPNVFIGPGVTIADGATIRAFSYLEGATIGAGAVVGPFARLRPGCDLGEGTRVGNFVEIKNASLGRGAKVNHLTYIGDATVGDAANVGAGTITCNYDGFAKHRTEIGAGAFIGSNSALVAPVRIGGGAYVGSGSVITRDVPDNALAVTRGPLDQRENWAARMRKRRQRPSGNKA